MTGLNSSPSFSSSDHVTPGELTSLLVAWVRVRARVGVRVREARTLSPARRRHPRRRLRSQWCRSWWRRRRRATTGRSALRTTRRATSWRRASSVHGRRLVSLVAVAVAAAVVVVVVVVVVRVEVGRAVGSREHTHAERREVTVRAVSKERAKELREPERHLGKAAEGGGRSWRAMEGRGGRWKAMGSWKAVEGRGGSGGRLVEGRRGPWRVVEARGCTRRVRHTRSGYRLGPQLARVKVGRVRIGVGVSVSVRVSVDVSLIVSVSVRVCHLGLAHRLEPHRERLVVALLVDGLRARRQPREPRAHLRHTEVRLPA